MKLINREVDVGKAIITIYIESEQSYRDDVQKTETVILNGRAEQFHKYYREHPAKSVFDEWKLNGVKYGVLELENGRFIPYSKCREIKVKYEPLKIKCKTATYSLLEEIWWPILFLLLIIGFYISITYIAIAQ